MFKWPNVFDIWNTYLTKFVHRYVSHLNVRESFSAERLGHGMYFSWPRCCKGNLVFLCC